MSDTSAKKSPREAVIRVKSLSKGFAHQIIFDELNLDVYRGEVLGIVGGSGTGKSVLMRCITGLMPFSSGCIEIFGKDVSKLRERERIKMDTRLGVFVPGWGVVWGFDGLAKYSGAHARTSGHAQINDG